MENNITSQKYWEEIESIVKNCFDEKEYDDVSEDTWEDRLYEIIDGHQWVIYTAYYFDVLKHSNNDEAIEDWDLEENSKKGFHNLLQIATCAAMQADCLDYFSRNREEILKEVA